MTPQITVTTHESPEAALEFMNRPEQLAPFDAYIADTKARAEQGLDAENLAVFRKWWSGEPIGDQAAWEAIFKTPAYGAIMQAISEGCG